MQIISMLFTAVLIIWLSSLFFMYYNFPVRLSYHQSSYKSRIRLGRPRAQTLTNGESNLSTTNGAASSNGDRSPIKIVSRCDNVSVTCDTRGNLAPCSVVVQKHPGTDWLRDRWQAASDMGGNHTIPSMTINSRYITIARFRHSVTRCSLGNTSL